MQTAAGHPKASRAQMVCAASLVNPVAVPPLRSAAAGMRTRATFVSLWAAKPLDHAVLWQPHEQLSTLDEEKRDRKCVYEMKNQYSQTHTSLMIK
jgi:hypothetical protein